MFVFSDIVLRRGPRLLFEGLSLRIPAGRKVGITGANGAGKSSLLDMVRGALQPDAGHILLPPQQVIAHVAQECPALPTAAIDYVMDGDTELRTIEAALAQAKQAGDGMEQAHQHARYEAIDGYGANSRAAQLMHGLGFSPHEDELPVSHFSGGWRMRLNLARALMSRSDVLLLDEPTNHLDLDAVCWLEGWLRRYQGTLLLISHDREFLDAIVSHILHIERARISLYTGNYSEFERQRAEQLSTQSARFQKQQAEIAHIGEFVRRFRAKATKARQAQSRLKALQRLELVAPAHLDSPFRFEFRAPLTKPHQLLRLEGVDAGYTDHVVVRKLDLHLMNGDRIGLLGPNGAGKSTLLKILADALPTLAGRCDRSQGLKVGYFAQHQLEQLRADDSPLSHLTRVANEGGHPIREQDARNFLGGFGFRGDPVEEPIVSLSGGEKSRLALATIVYERPNLLLLDEPTNHLDLEMRRQLAIALQNFEGAMVLVSHDRHLLRTVCDEFFLVSEGSVVRFEGDVDDYSRWLIEHRSESQSQREEQPETDGGTAAARRQQRREAAEQRRQLSPLRQEVARLEARIEELSVEKTGVESELTDTNLYSTPQRDKLKSLLIKQARIEQGLAETEALWIQACEKLEAADRSGRQQR